MQLLAERPLLLRQGSQQQQQQQLRHPLAAVQQQQQPRSLVQATRDMEFAVSVSALLLTARVMERGHTPHSSACCVGSAARQQLASRSWCCTPSTSYTTKQSVSLSKGH